MRPPTANRITQTQHGSFNAVDYSYTPDIDFYAPEDGTITSYVNNGDCGNNLQMEGASGRHGFCHLETSYVSVGQRVTKGQKIGKMGYTGYTIPSGPNGRHLHWVLRQGVTYVYPPSKVTEPFGGGNQMSTTDLGIARVLAYGVLGRDGVRNPVNALNGDCDADLQKNHMGQETNAKIWQFYDSAEGKNSRTLQGQLGVKANQVDALVKQVADAAKTIQDLQNQLATLSQENTALKEQNATLTNENTSLNATITAQQKTIADQAVEIEKLKKQVEAGGGLNPESLSGFGRFLYDIVLKYGMK